MAVDRMSIVELIERLAVEAGIPVRKGSVADEIQRRSSFLVSDDDLVLQVRRRVHNALQNDAWFWHEVDTAGLSFPLSEAFPRSVWRTVSAILLGASGQSPDRIDREVGHVLFSKGWIDKFEDLYVESDVGRVNPMGFSSFKARNQRNPSEYASPVTASRTADRLLRKYAGKIAKGTGLPKEVILQSRRIACGRGGGCPRRLPDGLGVLKITLDPNEVKAACIITGFGTHPHVIRVYAAGLLSRTHGYLWAEAIDPIWSWSDIGLTASDGEGAMKALQKSDYSLFIRCSARTLIDPLWETDQWLNAHGIHVWDWKRENLGITADGRVVLSDLGCDLI